MDFDWDEHNLFHIAMHGVTREEVEDAMQHSISVERSIRNNEVRTLHAGMTTSGRILAIVTTPRGDRSRVVTAFTAGKRVRFEYLARKGSV